MNSEHGANSALSAWAFLLLTKADDSEDHFRGQREQQFKEQQLELRAAKAAYQVESIGWILWQRAVFKMMLTRREKTGCQSPGKGHWSGNPKTPVVSWLSDSELFGGGVVMY